jgi:hypothetical protein
MSLDEVDFKETYNNTVSESNYLSPMLAKKLLSFQSWYAAQISSFHDVFEDVDTFFVLIAGSFNHWRRSQSHIRITATPLRFDPSPVLHMSLQLLLHHQHCQLQHQQYLSLVRTLV